MLTKLKQLDDFTLRASGEEIGRVRDVYFDDREWQTRYFVVQTGAWLNRRDVLIGPEAIQSLDREHRALAVSLSPDQVRNSPEVDTQKPVSRQREMELRTYYGWPAYWGSIYTEGVVPPVSAAIPPTVAETRAQETLANRSTVEEGDPHLRSARELTGYHVEATDGAIGHIEDLIVDDVGWAIRYLLIDTRNWLPGRKVIVAPHWAREISWETTRVYVDLTREAVRASPQFDDAAMTQSDYIDRLHDHYGRERYIDRPLRRP